jgi:hypothetical protein
MSIFVDDFGAWDNIGTMQLSPLQWVVFPGVIFSGELFRFTYITDWNRWEFALDDRVNIFCRFIYGTSDRIVSPSFLLYPKQEKEVRQYFIPQKFKDEDILERTLEVKAKRRYGRFISVNDGIADISLKVEYLI